MFDDAKSQNASRDMRGDFISRRRLVRAVLILLIVEKTGIDSVVTNFFRESS